MQVDYIPLQDSVPDDMPTNSGLSLWNHLNKFFLILKMCSFNKIEASSSTENSKAVLLHILVTSASNTIVLMKKVKLNILGGGKGGIIRHFPITAM